MSINKREERKEAQRRRREQYSKEIKKIEDYYRSFKCPPDVDYELIKKNLDENAEVEKEKIPYDVAYKMVLRLNELLDDKADKADKADETDEADKLKKTNKQKLIDSGMPPSTLSNYLTGVRLLKLSTLIDWKNKFNVSTDYLLGIENIATTNITDQEICKKIRLSEKSLKEIKELYEENEMLNPLYEKIVNIFIEGEYFSDIVRRLLLMCINANIDTLTETESKYAKARKALFMGDVDEYHFWKCRQDLYEIILDIANNINNNRYLTEKLMPLVYTGYNEFKKKAGDKS